MVQQGPNAAVVQAGAASEFPYGLVPFALYLTAIVAYLVWTRLGGPFAPFIADFLYLLSRGDSAPKGEFGLFFFMALIDVAQLGAIAVGLLLVVLAMLRKRAVPSVLVLWMGLNLLYVVAVVLINEGVTFTKDELPLLPLAIIPLAGIVYALRSWAMRAFFNR